MQKLRAVGGVVAAALQCSHVGSRQRLLAEVDKPGTAAGGQVAGGGSDGRGVKYRPAERRVCR